MNNKAKKSAKVAVFVSLIAVMILPFSTVDTVDAANQDRLDQKLQKLIKEIEKTYDTEKKTELQEKIDKIKIKLEHKKNLKQTTNTLIEKQMIFISELDADSPGSANAEKRLEKLENRLVKLAELDDEDKIIEGYDVVDIFHMFDVLEPYIEIIDAHIVLDVKSAKKDPHISKSDIRIMKDFIVVNNLMINQAYVGQQDESLVDEAIGALEAGRFHKLFDPIPATHPISTSQNNDIPIVFLGYDHVQAPTQSIFGVDQHSTITPTSHLSYEMGHKTRELACDGGFQHPHVWKHVVDKDYYYEDGHDLPSWLINVEGYELLRVPFTGHPGYDYTKVVTFGAPGNCNDGPFRDQRLITYEGGLYGSYNEQRNEPNPVLLYWWPSLWWGTYTYWWHNVYSDDAYLRNIPP